GAGVDMLKKLGEPVSKGEPLYRVHAEYKSDFHFARELSDRFSGYTIGEPSEVTKSYMEL
ncbi:MAG TPA: thymidine phosphorylase, partial [Gammaproteobacteria bacterium]